MKESTMIPSRKISPALQLFLARCAAVVHAHRPAVKEYSRPLDISEGEGDRVTLRAQPPPD